MRFLKLRFCLYFHERLLDIHRHRVGKKLEILSQIKLIPLKGYSLEVSLQVKVNCLFPTYLQ